MQLGKMSGTCEARRFCADASVKGWELDEAGERLLEFGATIATSAHQEGVFLAASARVNVYPPSHAVLISGSQSNSMAPHERVVQCALLSDGRLAVLQKLGVCVYGRQSHAARPRTDPERDSAGCTRSLSAPATATRSSALRLRPTTICTPM